MQEFPKTIDFMFLNTPIGEEYSLKGLEVEGEIPAGKLNSGPRRKKGLCQGPPPPHARALARRLSRRAECARFKFYSSTLTHIPTYRTIGTFISSPCSSI